MRDAVIPEPEARYLCITHPSATEPLLYCYSKGPVRLACLSHAASVRSEPGSNSSVCIVVSGPAFRPTRLLRLGSHTHCYENVRVIQPTDCSVSRLHTLPPARPGWSKRATRFGSGRSQALAVLRRPHVLTAINFTHCSLVKDRVDFRPLLALPQLGSPVSYHVWTACQPAFPGIPVRFSLFFGSSGPPRQPRFADGKRRNRHR